MPLPNPSFTPGGAITFPRSERGRLVRDHGFVQARTFAPCPGGIGYPCVVLPGRLMMAFLVRPENLMVVGCWEHVCEFAAQRGLEKGRRQSTFLASGLIVGEEHPAESSPDEPQH